MELTLSASQLNQMYSHLPGALFTENNKATLLSKITGKTWIISQNPDARDLHHHVSRGQPQRVTFVAKPLDPYAHIASLSSAVDIFNASTDKSKPDLDYLADLLAIATETTNEYMINAFSFCCKFLCRNDTNFDFLGIIYPPLQRRKIILRWEDRERALEAARSILIEQAVCVAVRCLFTLIHQKAKQDGRSNIAPSSLIKHLTQAYTWIFRLDSKFQSPFKECVAEIFKYLKVDTSSLENQSIQSLLWLGDELFKTDQQADLPPLPAPLISFLSLDYPRPIVVIPESDKTITTAQNPVEVPDVYLPLLLALIICSDQNLDSATKVITPLLIEMGRRGPLLIEFENFIYSFITDNKQDPTTEEVEENVKCIIRTNARATPIWSGSLLFALKKTIEHMTEFKEERKPFPNTLGKTTTTVIAFLQKLAPAYTKFPTHINNLFFKALHVALRVHMKVLERQTNRNTVEAWRAFNDLCQFDELDKDFEVGNFPKEIVVTYFLQQIRRFKTEFLPLFSLSKISETFRTPKEKSDLFTNNMRRLSLNMWKQIICAHFHIEEGNITFGAPETKDSTITEAEVEKWKIFIVAHPECILNDHKEVADKFKDVCLSLLDSCEKVAKSLFSQCLKDLHHAEEDN